MSADVRRNDLRKPTRAAAIVEDICERVQAGTLRAADRLATYRELLAHYGVSQSVLTKALDELAGRGIVVRRPRSGCFVADRALKLLQRESMDSRTAGTRDQDTHADLYDFNPYRKRPVVRMFICDSLPAKVAAWQTVAEEYRRSRGIQVVLSWSRLGFAGAHFDEHEFDIIHGPPTLLRHLGAAQFVAAPDLERLGLPPQAMLGALTDYCARTPALLGVPVAVMLPAMFHNLDLRSSCGVDAVPARTMSELADTIAAGHRAGRLRGIHGFHSGSLARALVYQGALRIDKNLRFRLDRGRAAKLLAALAQLTQASGEHSPQAAEEFLAGNVLTQASYTFFALQARERARFAWTVKPFPVAPGAQASATPLLLAIRTDTSAMNECIDLVQHLCGREPQQRLAETGDGLPARADVLAQPAVTKALGMPPAELAALLPSLCLLFGERNANSALDSDLFALGRLAEARGLAASETLNRLQILFARYEQMIDAERRACHECSQHPGHQ